MIEVTNDLKLVTIDPLKASDPSTANHHWYPFQRYQEECKEVGKEASINDWMRKSGQLKDLVEFEEAKEAASLENEAKK